MVTLAWLLWAAFSAFLIGWWLFAPPINLAEERPAPPPDPIVELVDKWAHDWERGRA